MLLAAHGPEPADEPSISWAAAAELPLCLLVPEMQNRRIVNAAFAEAGASTDAGGRDRLPWRRWSTMSARPGWSPWRPTDLVARLGHRRDAAWPFHWASPSSCTRWAWSWPTASPRRPFVAALWAAAQSLRGVIAAHDGAIWKSDLISSLYGT